MGYRLVPKSVNLSDLERRNGRVVCVISPNSVAFGACYVKVWLKIHHQHILRVKCSPKNLGFNDITYGDFRKGSLSARALK